MNNTLGFDQSEYLNDFVPCLQHRQCLGAVPSVITYDNPLAKKQGIKEVYVNPICIVLHSLGGDLNDGRSSFSPCPINCHLRKLITKDEYDETDDCTHSARIIYNEYNTIFSMCEVVLGV